MKYINCNKKISIMTKYFVFILILFFVSCQEQESSLLTIPVTPKELIDIPLSAITDKLEKIELETTEECLISKDFPARSTSAFCLDLMSWFSEVVVNSRGSSLTRCSKMALTFSLFVAR